MRVQGKTGRHKRQRGALALAFGGLLLASCAMEPEPSTLQLGDVIAGYIGGVAGDEPRSALIAQDVLASGGTAADAAVAMTFVMTVTYPAAASLGGGGACLSYDAATQSMEVLRFLPSRPAAGGIIAVPGTVRGMAALHSRYGRLEWDKLITPAEGLARRGHSVSRALAGPLQASRPLLLGDPGLRSIFLSASGKALAEGDNLSQIPLSALLAQIRVRGPGELYVGPAASNFVNGSRALKGAVTLADLRSYRPSWHEPAKLLNGKNTFFTSAGAMAGGAIAGQMWAMASEIEKPLQAGNAQWAHQLAEISSRAYVDRGSNPRRPLSPFRAHTLMTGYQPNRHAAPQPSGRPPLSPDLGVGGSTGFAVVDREGSAVACVLTMGRAFGAGKADRTTGLVFAAPGEAGDYEFLGSGIVLSNEGRIILVASAMGGPAGPAALMQSGLSAVDTGKLASAIDGPRVFHPGEPDQVYVEKGLDGAILADLRRRGHTLRVAASLGRVNAILCPGRLGAGDPKCEYRSDRRGFGLAVGGRF